MEDEVGQPIVAGIAQGILNNVDLIRSAASKAGQVTVTGAKAGVSAAGGAGALTATTSGGAGGGGSVYVDLRGSQMMTEKDMDILVTKMGRALAGQGHQ